MNKRNKKATERRSEWNQYSLKGKENQNAWHNLYYSLCFSFSHSNLGDVNTFVCDCLADFYFAWNFSIYARSEQNLHWYRNCFFSFSLASFCSVFSYISSFPVRPSVCMRIKIMLFGLEASDYKWWYAKVNFLYHFAFSRQNVMSEKFLTHPIRRKKNDENVSKIE